MPEGIHVANVPIDAAIGWTQEDASRPSAGGNDRRRQHGRPGLHRRNLSPIAPPASVHLGVRGRATAVGREVVIDAWAEPFTFETVGANDHSSAVEEQHTLAGQPQRAQDIFIKSRRGQEGELVPPTTVSHRTPERNEISMSNAATASFAHAGICTTIAGRTHQKMERVAEEIGSCRQAAGPPGWILPDISAPIDGGSTNAVGSSGASWRILERY